MTRFIIIASVMLSACQLVTPTEPQIDRLLAHNIQTSSGMVQGQSIPESSADVVSWFDIPYAQPPVGELRWKATRALQSPQHIIVEQDETACVQKASRYAGASGEGIVGAEDCLYLDIRAPVDFATKQYPVMVWIHGGANTTGLKDYYDFTQLVASQDVVVVTINYRLGALGWFTHPAIQGPQDGLDKASNFGTLDIIESLKWVQRNIQSFGGDANNVTVFGESAGAHNTLALLASPLSKGLFHKAISQSGYTTSAPLDDAYNHNNGNPLVGRGSWQIVNKILEKPQSQYSEAELRMRLLNMDAREFIGLYYETEGYDSIPLTTTDSVVIPKEGVLGALGTAKYAKNIPVIAGATKDEVSFWLGLHRYFADTSYIFTKLLPPKITIKNPEVFELWVRTRSHAWKLRGVDDALMAMEAAGYQDLFAYRFDWDHQKSSMLIDIPNIVGAAHGTDIAFVTGNYIYGPITSYIYPEGPARDQMGKTVMGAWSNFARTGNPSADMPFEWSRFATIAPAYVHLDKDDLLRMDIEVDDMDSLLGRIAVHQGFTALEKCFVAWESFTNVGDHMLTDYYSWNDGLCNQFDIKAEQRDLDAKLIKEYGSIEVF
ncbi:MAG: carboxylesterase family protein [Porticoccaceae bacterium]|nr:carboxylesterase family protein [Porticoccaceae bacterium]MDG1446483.1 carboxylesterase family protein [Porticoccaceae bacterium]